MDQEAINALLKDLPPMDDGNTLDSMLNDDYVMQLQNGTNPGIYPTDVASVTFDESLNFSFPPETTPALSSSLPDARSISAPLQPGICSGSQDELQPQEPVTNDSCRNEALAVPTSISAASGALNASSNLRRTSCTAVPTTLLAQNNAIGTSKSRTNGKENNPRVSNKQQKRVGDNVCGNPAK
jgi:hypothetical protein